MPQVFFLGIFLSAGTRPQCPDCRARVVHKPIAGGGCQILAGDGARSALDATSSMHFKAQAYGALQFETSDHHVQEVNSTESSESGRSSASERIRACDCKAMRAAATQFDLQADLMCAEWEGTNNSVALQLGIHSDCDGAGGLVGSVECAGQQHALQLD